MTWQPMNIRPLIVTLTLFCCFYFTSRSQKLSLQIRLLTEGCNTSLRGLSVVNDAVIWASGSNGMVARSLDSGRHWEWQQVKGYELLDFRDIEAFSEQKAIVLNAGEPANILLTEDGGNTWQQVYHNNTKSVFLDGMDWWDHKNGIAFGDPIDGKFLLLRTQNGGHTWSLIDPFYLPLAVAGEAAFAASGTAIRVKGRQTVFLGSGGALSRLFVSYDRGRHWKVYPSPFLQGRPSQGIFSIALRDKRNGIAVGGDYVADTLHPGNAALFFKAGRVWKSPQHLPPGYRSGVEYITDELLITCGPRDVNASRDGGNSWETISRQGFHVVRKAKRGQRVYLAGAQGRIAVLLD